MEAKRNLEIAQHALDLHKAGRGDLHILRYIERANGFRFEPKQGETRRELAAALIKSARVIVSAYQADPPDLPPSQQ